MKKTLLKENFNAQWFRFYLPGIIFLFISGFSFAGTVIKVSNKTVNALLKTNAADTITVRGTVTDASSGQSLPGASIRVKGTTLATTTNVNGNFTIRAASNGILTITFVGYEPRDVQVSPSNLAIKLQASVGSLNEVVVVGYGVQKKTSLTAAVSTITPTEITQKPVVNLTNALVGRATGLIATQSGGEPGFDGSNITIRGAATTGRTNALYVVDGVIRDFSRLDASSIETVTILKDAAAVAPYGVAGANGVILITTKAGKTGKPQLSYTGYYGIENPTKVPKFVNSYEYATLRNEAATNDGTALPYTANDIALFQNHQDPDGHADGHPLNDIIKPNRPLTYNNITLSGGTDDIKYFASLGYNRQDGMWDPTYLNKYAGSFSLTANATKTTTVNLRVSKYEEDQHFPSQGAGTIIGQAQRQNPTYPVQYSNGLGAGYIGQSLYGEIYQSGYGTNQNTDDFAQLSIEQKLPLKGLSIKATATYESGPDPQGFSANGSGISRTYVTPIPFSNPVLPAGVTAYGPGVAYLFPINIQGNSKPSLNEQLKRNLMFTYQGYINYARTFGKSDFSAVLVAEYRNVKWENFSVTKINFNTTIDELSFGGPLPTDVTTSSGSSGGQRSLGYVYRLDYTYNNRYSLEAAGRYDGSYLFAPGHRFGFFPAFSANWRISEEKFMKSVTWVDNLKLRASFGQSGNYPPGGQYQYLNQFGINTPSAVIGNNITQGISENLQGNPGITWEKSNKTDVGLEGTIFKGVLGVEADYFVDQRSNLLVGLVGTLPPEYGVGVGSVNGGNVINKGFELTLSSFKNFSKDVRLDVRATFTYARSRVVNIFEGGGTYNNPNTRQTGRPLGDQYGLIATGYYTNDDFVDPTAKVPVLKAGIPVPNFGTVFPGDLKYADISSAKFDGVPDGKVDANDRTDIGNSQTPKIIYGFEPRLTYKNFDIDVLIQGTGLSNVYLGSFYVNPFLTSGSATELFYQDHWTQATPNALYPRIHGTPTANNTQGSTWFLRNDSYIRLKSAEIGYTFSNKLLGHAIKSLRIYSSGENLVNWLPWAREKDFDPEEGGANQNYFQQRVFTFGLNATF